MQRDAIDFVQLVDGSAHRGNRSHLENFHIRGEPLLAVADGRVTAAAGPNPDEPVGGSTWHEMAGNHVILDVGGGRYVLYGHLMRDSPRVQLGDQVQRGQVIAQVGDSGNSQEPHLPLTRRARAARTCHYSGCGANRAGSRSRSSGCR